LRKHQGKDAKHLTNLSKKIETYKCLFLFLWRKEDNQSPNMKILRIVKWIVIVALSLCVILVVGVSGYMTHDKFGNNPDGQRLAAIAKADNFKVEEFDNIPPTPQLAEGYSFFDITYRALFNPGERRVPSDILPSIKTDLLSLAQDQDLLVWFGHSSYFIQIDGKRILVDPVFSGNASPIPGTMPSFKGTDIYTVDELPAIDYLFISHDHYDHLDYETIIKLKNKTKKVICGLGVGSHFEHWGYNPDVIIERNWNESIKLDDGFTAYVLPARHFSGRGFERNKTLWCSFLLQSPSMKIYMGGDSGYDTHFADIGKQFGEIDLAFLENGQYDVAWPFIHSTPEQVVKAAHDLNAKRVFPVHSSKFALANHPWDEPLIKVTEFNAQSDIPLVTPLIGELVYLKNDDQKFSQWWRGIK
jgi:L-ascorbate metabolism protein UlaG (beta-lactamase superfamily)